MIEKMIESLDQLCITAFQWQHEGKVDSVPASLVALVLPLCLNQRVKCSAFMDAYRCAIQIGVLVF